MGFFAHPPKYAVHRIFEGTCKKLLDPDGCMVRHKEADTAGTKTGMRLNPHIGGVKCAR